MTVNTPKTSEVAVKTPLVPVDGVLLLNKPFGLSSNTALQRARYLLRAKKAGHTGTLDPHATGLLPLCFGEATKFSQWILDAPKGYVATLRLGYTSDTLDGEGEIQYLGSAVKDLASIESVLSAMVGQQEQIPPMHAAIKVQGKPLYSYIRAGETIPREPRKIEVFSCQLISFKDDFITISCVVSKGTYIRVLASDIGQRLGCGAYLFALERTSTGPFQLQDALSLEKLTELAEIERQRCLLPVDSLLSGIASLKLSPENADNIVHGRECVISEQHDTGLYRVYNDKNRFLGLCELLTTNRLRPIRLMATDNL